MNFIDVPKGEGDEIETPPWLWDFVSTTFDIDWDACATNDNSLAGPVIDALGEWPSWIETIFMNPPYSKPRAFLAKAAEMSGRGVTTVALIKADHSTSWWRDFVAPYATIIPLPYRIRFYYKGRPCRHVANFPSTLAIYWGTDWLPPKGSTQT